VIAALSRSSVLVEYIIEHKENKSKYGVAFSKRPPHVVQSVVGLIAKQVV